MNLVRLSKTPRPSSTAASMEAKLSSVRIMSAASFGHVGAGDAHRDADVGLLERGRVVHAVAGHGDDVAARLQRLDQPQFLLGRDAGEHGGALGDVGQFFVGELSPVRDR